MESDKIIENYIIPIKKKELNEISKQMEKYICKIYTKDGDKGTGFFCFINLDKSERISVLITNNHLIDDYYIKEKKLINITLNDDSISTVIVIDENRGYHCYEKYDTTIIEILPEIDGITDFLNFDECIFDDEPEKYYKNKSVYIIHYPNNGQASVSFGIINDIYDYNIMHSCSTKEGSSGSPILNISSKKIIGVHKEGKDKFNFSKGIFLKYPINDFKALIKSNGNKIIKNISYLKINLDSLVIGRNEIYDTILKMWINPKKKITSKLLYRLSRDGPNFSTFHSLCDKKGPTLTLIELKDGYRLGMYTPLDWDMSDTDKNSSEIFVFSLTRKLISYSNPKSSGGMYCRSDTGPCSNYIGFQNNNGMNFILIYNSNGTFNDVHNFRLEEGKHYNKEVEVFQVIIES